MKWKNSSKEVDKDLQKKQSISSTGSMSFLRDENLTFHRFTTDMSVNSSRRPSDVNNTLINNNLFNNNNNINNNNNSKNNSTTTTITNSTTNQTNSDDVDHNTGMSKKNLTPAIWSTTNSNKFTQGTNNEFQYIGGTEDTGGGGGGGVGPADSSNKNNGSTAKLLPPSDDKSNKQSKCSVFRGVILCLCLNLTYANIVRFPRELEFYGSEFLIPYGIFLLFIGLPIVLLEMSLGQFLGQGAAHAWRASPIFRGGSIIARFASWLGAVSTSLQAVLAIVYIGDLIFKSVPFNACTNLRIVPEEGYLTTGKSGQECISQTLLTPVWKHSLYFSLLMMALIVLWIIAMICTYSSKTLRRSVFLFGLMSLILLAFETGWQVTQSIVDFEFLGMWPFNTYNLRFSSIWFSALVQVIFSTNIGIGVWPVITGKFLYKGDAVRTSIVYILFNILITILSVTFFMSSYVSTTALNSTVTLAELKPLTSIYDNAVHNTDDPLLSRLIPGLSYLLIVLVAIITISINIYTASRIIRRHPNYIMSIAGIVISIISLIAPKYLIARLLDTRFIGPLILCALIFDIISVMWIYGAKDIYTDLEFSIGRPILKLWLFIWCIIPIFLIGTLLWWTITYNNLYEFQVGLETTTDELLLKYLPKWLPVVISLLIIIILATYEVYKQVGYNFVTMICEAAQPSKDWGPADPIVRHAWKQWRSVCEDTGQRDFTLRRRGTRDYTHSIKRGQYGKYSSTINTQNTTRKLSTQGSNSPNYSGSIFGDSAIEEDMSIDKYPVTTSGNNVYQQHLQPLQQFPPQKSLHLQERRQTRYSTGGGVNGGGGSSSGGGGGSRRTTPISNGSTVSDTSASTITNNSTNHIIPNNNNNNNHHQIHRNASLQEKVHPPNHRQMYYVQSAASETNYNSNNINNNNIHRNISKIEITPAASASTSYTDINRISTNGLRNPLARVDKNPNYLHVTRSSSDYGSLKRNLIDVNRGSGGGGGGGIEIVGGSTTNGIILLSGDGGAGGGGSSSTTSGTGSSIINDNNSIDHLNWRKFSGNSQEFSTEL